MSQKESSTTGKILATSNAFWQSSALHAAVRLELFSIIGREKVSLEIIAGQTGADQRGLGMLLNAMVAMELLEKDEGLYGNTDHAGALLDKESPQYIGHIILHHHHLVDGWAQLDQAVVTGKPVPTRSYGDEVERQSFLLGMHNLAMGIAPRLAEKINFSDRRHLLDLGGGPGTYSIHFCKANDHLKSTIFDRSTTEPFAMQTINKSGLADRIDFISGDFNINDIPGSYDAAWLSHILHSNGPEQCRALLRKTAKSLAHGGLIMIHEFFLNSSMDGPLFPALFSLNMLINNDHGRSYSEQEIRTFLKEAGVGEISRLDFEGPNNSAILVGVRL